MSLTVNHHTAPLPSFSALVADNASENDVENPRPSLLTLSWEDIVFSRILPLLNWEDLYCLRGVSWHYREMMDEYFRQLKVIDLSSVTYSFTNAAFKVLTSTVASVRKLLISDSQWVLDKDLSYIFKNNRLLSILDLSGCTSLNGTCLLTLAVNCKQLNTLILRDCSWLSHGAVETLITHLDSLEVVDLSSCSALSNQQLLPFVQKFYRLKELHVANLQAVNDTTMLVIARNCTALKILDIRGCGNTSDRGVKMIAEYCHKLTALSVLGCHLVTEFSLRLLRSRGVQIDRERAGELVPYIPFLLQV